jgi:hypothetical protein
MNLLTTEVALYDLDDLIITSYSTQYQFNILFTASRHEQKKIFLNNRYKFANNIHQLIPQSGPNNRNYMLILM